MRETTMAALGMLGSLGPAQSGSPEKLGLVLDALLARQKSQGNARVTGQKDFVVGRTMARVCETLLTGQVSSPL